MYGAPAAQTPVIGVTGTNGKTTTSYLIASILSSAGYQPVLVGSIEGRFGSLQTDAANTTPEAPDLHRFWSDAQSRGADALVMEASSHGLLLHRVDGIGFNVGVFTNLTRDHLDYHPDHAAYRGAKTRLFGALPLRGLAVLNADDPEWEAFARATHARVVTYGVSENADVWPEHTSVSGEGIKLRVATKTGPIVVESRLFGRFNVSNLLAATAVGWALKLKSDVIAAGLAAVGAVPGRAERVDCGQPFVTLNDFAHTPDALARVLAAARELTAGKLHVVFGCGGDRDPGKRPQMGLTAVAGADRVIVTSDNPRTEDPDKIIEQVVAPVKDSPKLTVEKNREAAIRFALEGMDKADTLVVAGKGHERYQIVGSEKRRFDDAEVIRTELHRMGYRK
jgi:UDP-N-acetylmuramoyl-L-alanyl-D-glutamate--2,6-diaminopimelate ligase